MRWLVMLACAAGCGTGSAGAGDAGAADAPSLPDAPAPPDASRPDASAIDCASIPPGPFTPTLVPGVYPNEDVAFSSDGYLYWNQSNRINRTLAGGATSVFVTGIEFTAGMRLTPSGDLYVNDDWTSQVWRIRPDGARFVVMSGLDFLNGLEVDREGRVYLTDFGAGSVFRYDPATDVATPLLTGALVMPNGITFNRAFDALYIGTWGGDPVPTIHWLPIDASGAPGALEPWATNVGNGGLYEGMGVDACGNVYVGETERGQVWRVSEDGVTRELVVDRPGATLHNLNWGRGSGWPEDHLYIVSVGEGLLEIDLGVSSKNYW